MYFVPIYSGYACIFQNFVVILRKIEEIMPTNRIIEIIVPRRGLEVVAAVILIDKLACNHIL